MVSNFSNLNYSFDPHPIVAEFGGNTVFSIPVVNMFVGTFSTFLLLDEWMLDWDSSFHVVHAVEKIKKEKRRNNRVKRTNCFRAFKRLAFLH